LGHLLQSDQRKHLTLKTRFKTRRNQPAKHGTGMLKGLAS
jgi:hypothetical protein